MMSRPGCRIGCLTNRKELTKPKANQTETKAPINRQTNKIYFNSFKRQQKNSMCQRPSLSSNKHNNNDIVAKTSRDSKIENNNNPEPNNDGDNATDEHGSQTPFVNASLIKNPKYAKVLFGKLTPHQERAIHYKPMYEWIKCWVAILVYSYFPSYIPRWIFLLYIAQRVAIHANVGHDSIHLRSKPIWEYRIFGSILFCAGFIPVAPCITDIRSVHCHDHHRTKGPLSPSKYDEDSKWAKLPMWQMVVNFFLMPGHASVVDILFHQYPTRKASLEERVTTNFFHWLQLATMYHVLGNQTFWYTLMTGHVAMFFVWIVFSGFVHRPSFYEFLIWVDPSGRRRIPVVDPILYALAGRGLTTEVKFHDVHHTHGAYVRSLAAQLERSDGSWGWDEIEECCADIVDEGLLIDPITLLPMSGLSEINHQLGTRKRS